MHHRLLLQELGSTLTLFLTTHHSPLNLHPYSQVARQPSAGQEAVEAVRFDLYNLSLTLTLTLTLTLNPDLNPNPNPNPKPNPNSNPYPGALRPLCAATQGSNP